MFQEYHRLAGVFAAYPAPLKPPQPCRDPGPGRVNHLHHHTPVTLSKSPHNQGNQPADCTTQHQAPEYLGCEPRSPDGSPPNRRADHTDHNDQATHSSSRKGQTPLEVLEDSEGRNPLITWDLDLYPQPRPTPTHPHSTRKSQFDRGPGSARGRLRHVRARGAAPEDERIKRDGQGPARPGRPAPRTHAPRPRGGGGARRGACAPRSRQPCVT